MIPGYLDNVTGEYSTPQGYFVDEKEAEEFDKMFAPKEKLKLPGAYFAVAFTGGINPSCFS